MTPVADPLAAAITTFVRGGPGALTPLALALFARHHARNPAYAALAGDAAPARLEEIPAVPVSLFRDLELRAFDGPPGAVFRTSGTTTGGAARGTHAFADLALTTLAARVHYAARVPEAPRRVVSLVSHTEDSSLGHMVAAFADPLLPFFRDGEVDPAAWAALDAPCLLATTAFALDALLASPGTAHLDERSVVMVTGGFKGRRVRLDAPALYRSLTRLGRPRVVGEYGMTELSSQLWTDPVPAGEVPGPFVAPRWLHAYTVDPMTGTPTEDTGLLRFVDLANLWSVPAIETMDLGRVEGDRVTLLGRLEGAELRGCSLRAEDFLATVRGARGGPPPSVSE